LTPKLGMFSADTWVLVSTYLRNLMLNWLLIAQLLIALVAVPRMHVSLLNTTVDDQVTAGGFFSGVLLMICGIAFSAMNRPAVQQSLERHCHPWFARRDQRHFLIWCFAPLCCSAVCIT